MTKRDYTGIETNPDTRWEQGTAHHPKSLELYKEMADLDLKFNSDYFCWKDGGDGDNGEELLYILDIIFERKDRDE